MELDLECFATIYQSFYRNDVRERIQLFDLMQVAQAWNAEPKQEWLKNISESLPDEVVREKTGADLMKDIGGGF